MRIRSLAGWVLAAAVSGALSWSAWVGPDAPQVPPTPAARPRPPTDAERAAIERDRARLEREVAAARAALGRAIPASELEGVLPGGQPILPGGIPDNPLVPGVGGVVEECGGSGLPARADWHYCPETGSVKAGSP